MFYYFFIVQFNTFKVLNIWLYVIIISFFSEMCYLIHFILLEINIGICAVIKK